jgi:hypothetical protein
MARFSNPFVSFRPPADRRRRHSVRFTPEGLEPRLSPSDLTVTVVNVPSDPLPPPPPPPPPTDPPTGPVGPA